MITKIALVAPEEERSGFFFELLEGFDLGQKLRTRPGWKLTVVLVKAGLGALRGVVAEQNVVEVMIGQSGELRIAALRQAHAGQIQKQNREKAKTRHHHLS